MLNTNQKAQTGDVLLEALISIVLMAVIVLGVALITGQAAKNISETKSNIFVVNALKSKLISQSRDELCGQDNVIHMPDSSEITLSKSHCNSEVNVEFEFTTNGASISAAKTPTKINAPIVVSATVNGLDYSVGGVK